MRRAFSRAAFVGLLLGLAAGLPAHAQPVAPVRVCAEVSASQESSSRLMAVRALADFQDPVALSPLKARLDDEMTAVALLAARGAAQLDDAEGRERLVQALSSDVPSQQLLAGFRGPEPRLRGR